MSGVSGALWYGCSHGVILPRQGVEVPLWVKLLDGGGLLALFLLAVLLRAGGKGG